MNRLLPYCVAALIAGAAGSASAQVAGTYSGTATDGSGITFGVATDPNTGALAVTSASVGFSAACKKSTTILNTGWGYGLTADIAQGKASNETTNDYFDIAFTIAFSKDGQSATGTVSAISPDLTYVGNNPPAKSALFCTSKKQAFTLTLQEAAKAAPVAPHGAWLLTTH